MKKLILLMTVLLMSGVAIANEEFDPPKDKFVEFCEVVKLSDYQKSEIIRLCNWNFCRAQDLFTEIKDLNWYIPNRRIQDIASDAIKGAITASHSGDKKTIVFNAVYNVVAELSSITWDQYWEYKGKVERAAIHYENYLFYLQILRNDK